MKMITVENTGLRTFSFKGRYGGELCYGTKLTGSNSDLKRLVITNAGNFPESMELEKTPNCLILSWEGNVEEEDLLQFFHELYLELYERRATDSI